MKKRSKKLLVLALVLGGASPYTEQYRPQLHYTPAANWMNDPNGLIYAQGEYHLFYQYNPLGIRWGHMSWGHAVSSDLLHWRELPLAIDEDAKVMIFSGSAVSDTANASGFGTPGHTPLVAIYTGAIRNDGGQSQHIAYSLDHGRSFTKFAGNPVLDLGMKDFRDPKVIWHAPTHSWVMSVVRSAEHKISFYRSPDLKIWNHLSDFGPEGATDGVWECPDLFAMHPKEDPSLTKWVLKVDVQNSSAAPGGQYFIGNFDGKRFTADLDAQGHALSQPLDHGADFYASNSWTDAPDGRRILLGWMNNWRYGQDIPTTPWRSAMSLPRELTLSRNGTGYSLHQAPIAALAGLRRDPHTVSGISVQDGSRKLFSGAAAQAPLEISADLLPGTAQNFGLVLSSEAGEEAEIGYDRHDGTVFIKRPGIAGFAGTARAKLALGPNGPSLHIILDRASIELFTADGKLAMTEQIFPKSDITGISIIARHGSAVLRSMSVWQLRSVWRS